MAIYRFRVTFEDFDDVSRDIEIKATQTFQDLNYAIHGAIGFDASKPASFYMSDDNWKKGKEITSRDQSEEENPLPDFRRSRLCDFIADPHQKIYYVFDNASPWTFRIELIKILPNEDIATQYPKCTRSVGEAPKQYGQLTPGVLPVPEDFDPDFAEDNEVEEVEEIIDTVEDDLPEGEIKPAAFEVEAAVSGELDEFETAGEDIADDEVSTEADDF